VREAARDQPKWRHHLPFSFFLIALTSLVVAICQPVITMEVPSKQGIIILALDAAGLAAVRGIRVYTVGLSSPSGPIDTSCQSSNPSGLKNVFQDAQFQKILVSENFEVTFVFIVLRALFAMISFFRGVQPLRISTTRPCYT
jgi:hypothetical protein